MKWYHCSRFKSEGIKMASAIVFLCVLAAAFASSPEENLNLGRSAEQFFEGDIVLTPEQRQALSGMTRGSVTRRLWPSGRVPYVIEADIANQTRAMNAIKDAFNAWESTTCIRFVQRTNETGYISIFKGSGCWSYVGRTGRKQQLSLAGGCWYKGTVAHELGHALGFYHEQSRPDRDNYVTIKWENIREKNKHNFNMHNSIDSLGTPYDYGSIMHYGERYFTKNGQPTIVTKNGEKIGNRRDLSSIDIKQMKLLYKCSSGGSGGGNGGGNGNGGAGSNCNDLKSSCPYWAKKGYCQGQYETYMNTYCKKSCNKCV